jgi:tight adherence protein C
MVNMEGFIISILSFSIIALLLKGVMPKSSEKAVDRLIKRQIEMKRQEREEKIRIQSSKPFKKLGTVLQKYFTKTTDTPDSQSSNETKTLLTQAGFRENYALYLYTFSQLVGAIVGLILGLIFAALEPLEGTLAMLPYIIGPAIGVYIPILYVKNRRNQRVLEIQRIFPDALEMLALCNEASMTIDMALPKLAHELEKKYPVISEEFSILSIELAMLDSRARAFDGFYKRFPLDEVRSFVTTINQAERTGTPIATSMRRISAEMRKDRIARIQAKLEALANKLVLPLIAFFFVPMMIFMVMPIFSKVDLSGM